MNNSVNRKVSEKIAGIRKLNRLTQAEFAEKIGVDSKYYSQLERGERNFSIDKVANVCTVFNIEINEIIEVDPSDDKETEAEKRNLIADITAALEQCSVTSLKRLSFYMNEIIK